MHFSSILTLAAWVSVAWGLPNAKGLLSDLPTPKGPWTFPPLPTSTDDTPMPSSTDTNYKPTWLSHLPTLPIPISILPTKSFITPTIRWPSATPVPAPPLEGPVDAPLTQPEAEKKFAKDASALTNIFPIPPVLRPPVSKPGLKLPVIHELVDGILFSNDSSNKGRNVQTGGFRPPQTDLVLSPLRNAETLELAPKLKNVTINARTDLGGCAGGIGCCPDPRYNFHDLSYPYRAIGRITVDGGICAGTLVGPRHVLTAGHCVNWNSDGQGNAGWMQFQPDYDNAETFTTYDVERVLSPAHGAHGDPTDEETAGLDFVVAILSDRAGDSLGWLGSKVYNTAWNGGAYWSHVGYPGDVGGGQRPAWDGGPFSIYDAWHPGFVGQEPGLNIEFFQCVSPGDSGGPIYGTWADGIYLIGLVGQSGTLPGVLSAWAGRTGNWAAGGSQMVDLIIKALGNYP